jgi:uncharacterized protein YjcR
VSEERKGPKCGRKTRIGGKCKNAAGFKTLHVGQGACYLHGGASTGAPKGNKNALVTGEYETLYLSTLLPPEKKLYSKIEVLPQPQCENSIRLASIREHRIMIRIKRAEETAGKDQGLALAKSTTEQGMEPKGGRDMLTVEKAPVVDLILRLEHALSGVQTLKVRYIAQLAHTLEKTPKSTGGLEGIVAAIDRSAREIALRREAERDVTIALDNATGNVPDLDL